MVKVGLDRSRSKHGTISKKDKPNYPSSCIVGPRGPTLSDVRGWVFPSLKVWGRAAPRRTRCVVNSAILERLRPGTAALFDQKRVPMWFLVLCIFVTVNHPSKHLHAQLRPKRLTTCWKWRKRWPADGSRRAMSSFLPCFLCFVFSVLVTHTKIPKAQLPAKIPSCALVRWFFIFFSTFCQKLLLNNQIEWPLLGFNGQKTAQILAMKSNQQKKIFPDNKTVKASDKI